MKVLAINGSPHKGNTLKVIKSVSEILEESKEIQVEIIHLSDLNLQTCMGCFQCILKGSENCPLKDDRDFLISKIMDSDGVIFGSPVYVMHVTSIFKNMVDRFAFICHRPRFFKKPAMVVSTTAAWGLKDPLKYMEGVINVWGFSVTTKLGLKTPPHELYLDKHKKKIASAASEFYNSLKRRDNIKPSTMQVVQFYVQRRIFGDPQLKDIMPRDYIFFNNEVGKYYFTDSLKVSLSKRMLGRLISKLIKI
ncbi:MAG: flavodoxin family protein [bacterium]|nr:flavodoxin family protein [bacterium]